MIKPFCLKRGDTICVLSLSRGGPHTFPERYEAGKKQLEEWFWLRVIEWEHTFKDASWLENNPQARADDLMNAFKNPAVKWIFTSIWWEDSIRLLPFIDFEIIKNNPKVVLGYSDTTILHFMCFKAGLTSFYGPSIMAWFGENWWLFPYMVQWLEHTIFSNGIVWPLLPNKDERTSENLSWSNPKNQHTLRKREIATWPRWIHWKGRWSWRLLWGCLEVLEFAKSTTIWPDSSEWKDTILFLEPSEELPTEDQVKYWLRNYASQWILKHSKWILFWRSKIDKDWSQINYDDILLKIIRDEEQLDIPIITNMDFGHTDPMLTIPYGVNCIIDCENQLIKIDETCCL